MLQSFALSLALAFAAAGAANAATVPARMGSAATAVITVGENCGANHWRGPGGHCNVFPDNGGNRRGTYEECPRGFHFVPGTGRCFHN